MALFNTDFPIKIGSTSTYFIINQFNWQKNSTYHSFFELILQKMKIYSYISSCVSLLVPVCSFGRTCYPASL